MRSANVPATPGVVLGTGAGMTRPGQYSTGRGCGVA
jgi:hypothetical protein